MACRANSKGPRDWPAPADDFHAARQRQLGAYRQHTLRESRLSSSHPPSGPRARMVEAWPRKAPAFVVSEQEPARIDAELSRW